MVDGNATDVSDDASAVFNRATGKPFVGLAGSRHRVLGMVLHSNLERVRCFEVPEPHRPDAPGSRPASGPGRREGDMSLLQQLLPYD